LNSNGKENTLHPDTIMKTGKDEIFVLDAKYYAFMLDKNDLPSAADINKQVRYGAYAHEVAGKKCDVYNAFVLPYDFKDNRYKLPLKKYGNGECYAYIGSAYLLNKNKKTDDDDKNHKRVLGVLVDTKWLMDHLNYAKKSDFEAFIREQSGTPEWKRTCIA
jgi:hypothetical protein